MIEAEVGPSAGDASEELGFEAGLLLIAVRPDKALDDVFEAFKGVTTGDLRSVLAELLPLVEVRPRAGLGMVCAPWLCFLNCWMEDEDEAMLADPRRDEGLLDVAGEVGALWSGVRGRVSSF